MCDKGYIWNPSTCACECDKCCELGQYLGYKNWVCRKKLIDDLIEQCTSIADMEIKNGVCSAANFMNSTSTIGNASNNNSNIYLFLFIAVLIVAALLVAWFVYYCRYDNSKKLDNKIYDVAYSNTGTLTF